MENYLTAYPSAISDHPEYKGALKRRKYQNNQNCHFLIKLVIFSLAKTLVDDRIR